MTAQRDLMLIVPGFGSRDAFTRRADTWPRHRTRAQQRRRRLRSAARDRRRGIVRSLLDEAVGEW